MSLMQNALNEPDYQRIKNVLRSIQQELDSELVLLIDRTGQQIACEGPAKDLDLTSIASLAAASLAATDELALTVGEKEFSALFQQGRQRSIHISSLDNQFCLVLLFGERVSPGLVRWKVKRAAVTLTQVFHEQRRQAELADEVVRASGGKSAPLFFTDEDIEKLFGQ